MIRMKQSLYLETSVIGAYLDNGEPFRRDLTIRWWEHEMPDYRAVISPLVSRELERVAEPRARFEGGHSLDTVRREGTPQGGDSR